MVEPCRADKERFDSVAMSNDDNKDTGRKYENGTKGKKSAKKYRGYQQETIPKGLQKALE